MLRKRFSEQLRRTSEFKGIIGIIERCTRKQIIEWLVTSNTENPNPQKFLVMHQGKDWIDHVELLHRPGLSDYKKDNVYGFRLFLKPGLKDTMYPSVFYCQGEDFYTISLIPEWKIELACGNSEAHFYNRVFAGARLQGVTIQQPELIAESLKTGKHHELNDSVSTFYCPQTLRPITRLLEVVRMGTCFCIAAQIKLIKMRYSMKRWLRSGRQLFLSVVNSLSNSTVSFCK